MIAGFEGGREGGEKDEKGEKATLEMDWFRIGGVGVWGKQVSKCKTFSHNHVIHLL